MNTKLKGVFFDLNGTLLVYGNLSQATKDHEEEIYQFLNNRGMNISRELFDTYVQNYFKIERPVSLAPEMTLFEYKLQKLGQLTGVHLKTEELHELATKSINAWAKHHPLDQEAIEVLEKLKRNYTLALITDFDHPPFIHIILQKYNLLHFFKYIYISADVGANKPHPKMFLKALKETQLTSKEVSYIGDSVEHDVNGALGVGMLPIQINRKNHEDIIQSEEHRGFIINHLRYLPNLLKKIQNSEVNE